MKGEAGEKRKKKIEKIESLGAGMKRWSGMRTSVSKEDREEAWTAQNANELLRGGVYVDRSNVAVP